MKYVPVALAILLAVAACGKYDIYKENLQFMTAQTIAAEKVATAQRVQETRAALARAEASGDSEKIKAARADLADAQAREKALQDEETRRSRHW